MAVAQRPSLHFCKGPDAPNLTPPNGQLMDPGAMHTVSSAGECRCCQALLSCWQQLCLGLSTGIDAAHQETHSHSRQPVRQAAAASQGSLTGHSSCTVRLATGPARSHKVPSETALKMHSK